jgi:hypothetical protein
MEEDVRPIRPAFYLYPMSEDQLIGIAAEVKINVLPMAQEGEYLFHLLGQPEDVQRMLNAVKTRNGVVRVYRNLEMAQARNN